MSLGIKDEEIQTELQGHEFLKEKDFYGSTVLFPASRYLKAKPVFYSFFAWQGQAQRESWVALPNSLSSLNLILSHTQEGQSRWKKK